MEDFDPPPRVSEDTSAVADQGASHRIPERYATPAQRDAALRERLRMALRELASCRDLLESNGVPLEANDFSCDPADHADVLSEEEPPAVEPPAAAPVADDLAPQQTTPAVEPAVADLVVADELDLGLPLHMASEVELTDDPADDLGLPVRAEEPEMPEMHSPPSSDNVKAAPIAPVSDFEMDTAGGLPAGVAASSSAVDSGIALEQAMASSARSEKERLEVELSMAKALLMLNNVNINMDFDQEDAPLGSAAQVVNLKGNRHLVQALLALKQKVSLLNQQYLLLRGDMLYMNHEMNVCRHWILQSFRMAMQHQSQEHSSLQTRFERLSKVLT